MLACCKHACLYTSPQIRMLVVTRASQGWLHGVHTTHGVRYLSSGTVVGCGHCTTTGRRVIKWPSFVLNAFERLLLQNVGI